VAKRVREAALKRARERARQEKQEAKRERRLAIAEETDSLDTADENALMEEFAELSARYESSEVSEAEFQTERERIFTLLGLETPTD
jgi:hypothetical protein